MKTSDYVKGFAIGSASITAKMIFENMTQRTVGKALSKITIPGFIISMAVIGGYSVSEVIDPSKGADRFTYAIMNPKEAAVKTGAITLHEFGEHIPIQSGTPMQPVYSPEQHNTFMKWAKFGFQNFVRF